MPVPWATGQHVLAPNVVDRGITVRQLRALRLFLQRLCKARLLRFTAASPFAAKRHGEHIEWHELNLYNMVDEVIKKVIPAVLSDGALFIDIDSNRVAAPPQGKWCSWSELVMERGRRQTASIMFSHWWGGPFRDFMAAVDTLVLDKALSTETTIWICTFANNQFGEDFGSGIKDSPFIKALEIASTTILIIDRYQGSLGRTWCGLELHYSLRHDKDVELYTPSGRVGSARASSGPLVEAVKDWDIRCTECSEESFRRQILNYIAGVDETAGLLTDCGALIVDRGRPMLDLAPEAQPLDPELPRAQGRRGLEFAHESRLFRTHRKAFENLNMMIRLEVMARIGKKRRQQSGCKVEQLAWRGVTLGQLRTFAKQVEDSFESEPWGSLQWQDVDLRDVMHHFILPRTKLERGLTCSYMELVSEGPQIPNFFVSYASSSPFCGFIKTIDNFAEAKHLPDATKFWIYSLAVDMHQGEEYLPCVWSELCRELAPNCEGLLACLTSADCHCPARFWRLAEYELFGTMGKDIYLACPTGVLACSSPLNDGNWVFGFFDPGIAWALRAWRFDISDIAASDTWKRAGVLEHLRGMNPMGTDDRFNAQLCRWAAGPVLRSAAARGRPEGVEAIRTVCGTPGLWVNSRCLSGWAGDTALHVAAAAGQLDAMGALLEAQADPNAEDSIRERPLHYAALAGQARAAQLLLKSGADPDAESSFRETALQVAEQSPASFLGTIPQEGIVGVLRGAAGAKVQPRGAVGLAGAAHCAPVTEDNEAARAALSGLVRALRTNGVREFSAQHVDRLLEAAGACAQGQVDYEKFFKWIFGANTEPRN